MAVITTWLTSSSVVSLVLLVAVVKADVNEDVNAIGHDVKEVIGASKSFLDKVAQDVMLPLLVAVVNDFICSTIILMTPSSEKEG